MAQQLGYAADNTKGKDPRSIARDLFLRPNGACGLPRTARGHHKWITTFGVGYSGLRGCRSWRFSSGIAYPPPAEVRARLAGAFAFRKESAATDGGQLVIAVPMVVPFVVTALCNAGLAAIEAIV